MTDRRICRKATDAKTVISETKKNEVSLIPNEKAIVYRNYTCISGLSWSPKNFMTIMMLEMRISIIESR